MGHPAYGYVAIAYFTIGILLARTRWNDYTDVHGQPHRIRLALLWPFGLIAERVEAHDRHRT